MTNTTTLTEESGAPTTGARKPAVELEPLSRGLPSRYYTDPRVADLEQERIFNRTWQLVGHVTDLPSEGSRFVASLGRTEVVVVRSKSDEVLAHVNTCRHRGTRLVSEPGEAKAFRCPYHGWTYHLDGQLVGAPEGRTIPCLDKSRLSLFSAKVEVISGLIFVNLDQAAEPLAPQLDGIRPLLDRYLGGEMEVFGKHRLHLDDPADHQASNWKIGVDNYLEGYHVPIAHPGLMRLLDYKRYSVETAHAYAVYDAPLRDKPSDNWAERLYQRLVRPMPGLAKEDERVFRYIAIYPNTVIDLYPDHVLLWRLTPQGVDRVGVPGTYLRRKNGDVRTRIAQRLNLYFSQITTHEDEDLVGWMQRGLSNFEGRGECFTPGPLSLREKAVAWFADRVRGDLGDLADLERELDR